MNFVSLVKLRDDETQFLVLQALANPFLRDLLRAATIEIEGQLATMYPPDAIDELPAYANTLRRLHHERWFYTAILTLEQELSKKFSGSDESMED